MILYDFLEKNNRREYELLKEKFPEMYYFSRKVKMIDWRKDFNVADYNVDYFDNERDNENIKYASRTLGIAFIKERELSFRDENPDPYTVIHELGHIYFKINDYFWNAVYGGAEILLWLGIKNKFAITEENIRHYIRLLKETVKSPKRISHFIASSIANKINVYPHLFPILIYAGSLPDGINMETTNIFDLSNCDWKQFEIKQENIFFFFQNLVEGLKFNDSIYTFYAMQLKIVGA